LMMLAFQSLGLLMFISRWIVTAWLEPGYPGTAGGHYGCLSQAPMALRSQYRPLCGP
jgi:hypothetical protein